MQVTVCILLFLIFVIPELNAWSRKVGERCETTRGIKGTCTSLVKCQHFKKESEKFRPGEIVLALQGDPCVFADPMGVCCSPSAEELNEPPPPFEAEIPTENDYRLAITTEPGPVQNKPLENDLGVPNKVLHIAVTTEAGSYIEVSHENRHLLPETKCGRIKYNERVMGGNITALGDYPWMALLGSVNRSGIMNWECGGSLISSRYVLTAAHCLLSARRIQQGLKLVTIRLGEWDQTTELDCTPEGACSAAADYRVEEQIPHEGWTKNTRNSAYDIGLVRLDRDVVYTDVISPICLPLDSVADSDFINRKPVVTGWGRTNNRGNSNSNILLQVRIPVLNFDQCQTFYRKYSMVKLPPTGQLCAGGRDGEDSCGGDSGGPLQDVMVVNGVVRWFLLGLVSGGTLSCGVQGRPSIYTKVPDYNGWILDHIAK